MHPSVFINTAGPHPKGPDFIGVGGGRCTEIFKKLPRGFPRQPEFRNTSLPAGSLYPWVNWGSEMEGKDLLRVTHQVRFRTRNPGTTMCQACVTCLFSYLAECSL